jgi:hypothetical protein
MPECAAEKRRRRRGLRLRVLMAAVLVIGCGLGWLIHRERVQREAVATLEAAGAAVVYNWVYCDPTAPGLARSPSRAWAVDALGPDFFGNIVQVYANPEKGFGDEQMVALGRLPHLEWAMLDRSEVTDEGLAHLRLMSRLEFLSLGSNVCITDRGLAHLQGLGRLETLIITSARIRGPGLAYLSGLARLKMLDLELTAPSDDDLAPLSRLKSLEDITLSGERLTDAGLAAFASMPNLREVSFRCCRNPGITSAGMIHFADHSRLEKLYLCTTSVTSIEHLKNLPMLKKLDLRDSPIDDVGLEQISGLQGLETLWLSGTKITDASIPRLATLKSLKYFDVDGTRITPEGAKRLRKALRGTDD